MRGASISVDMGESETEKLGNLPKLMVCKLIPSPVTVWRKYSCLSFCMLSEAEVASFDLSALDFTCSSFSYEENRARGYLCAQYVPRVYMKEIQTVTIRFFKSKSKEKVEKNIHFAICLCGPIQWKKFLNPSFFFFSIFPFSGHFRYSFLNFLTNVFFVFFSKCMWIEAKRKKGEVNKMEFE